MSIYNNPDETEMNKSSRGSKKTRFSQFLNITDMKQLDFTEQLKLGKTPREKKIFFPRDSQVNRLRKNFFDENATTQTEEDKKWYPKT
jgi:hypothetical protein